MSKREPLLLVADILEAAKKIQKFTKGMNLDKFVHDEKTVESSYSRLHRSGSFNCLEYYSKISSRIDKVDKLCREEKEIICLLPIWVIGF